MYPLDGMGWDGMDVEGGGVAPIIATEGPVPKLEGHHWVRGHVEAGNGR
jgi:hypothetical protein